MYKKKSGISPSNCVYTSCYCEENVWKLCEKIKIDGFNLDSYHVVFISNSSQRVPIWMQRKSSDPLSPVVWDYHVILVKKEGSSKAVVFDLDCVLHFPCPFDIYIEHAIQKEDKLRREFHRKFRVIPASRYLEAFASDRSHMKQQDGTWIATPPSYPPIRTSDSSMNLHSFISMDRDSGEGHVSDCDGFIETFS